VTSRTSVVVLSGPSTAYVAAPPAPIAAIATAAAASTGMLGRGLIGLVDMAAAVPKTSVKPA
jgi:hypothetical protein